MTRADKLYIDFLTLLGEVNVNVSDIRTDDVFVFINKAVDAFIEQVFKSFESEQQRIDDIQVLVSGVSLIPALNKVTLPDDYKHFVSLSVTDTGCKISNVEQITHGELRHAMLDPFKRPDSGSLLFTIKEDKLDMYSDRAITSITLIYVRKHQQIKIAPTVKQYSNIDYTDTLLLNSNKILDIAVRMYVAALGKDYNTKNNEKQLNY